jgi:Zn-dependent metalloprotease
MLFYFNHSFGQIKQPKLPDPNNVFKKKVDNNINIPIITPGQDNPKFGGQLPDPVIELDNSRFSLNVSKRNISIDYAKNNFVNWLKLSQNNSFQKISEKVDELGYLHINYGQQYKGVKVDESIVMLHFKEGKLVSMNGLVHDIKDLNINTAINDIKAVELAKNHLKVEKTIQDYPVQTLIVSTNDKTANKFKLARMVRIDSYKPFMMYNVYIDAQTGDVINTVSLIADADVPGTAQTLYSGAQNITCDSYNGKYRLRESGRKIETYDATNANGLNTGGFVGSVDYFNSNSNWGSAPFLSSYSISQISNSWWYTTFTDESPDLYIVIKDASSNIVYKSISLENKFPPITFNNLNIYLVNPPYTIEIWDKDVIDDDFGVNHQINLTDGNNTWNVNGNNGTYLVINKNNPALDVHWGMEKTYDFYFNVFSRKSYDNKGAVIKNYLNDPTKQIIPGCTNCIGPNGASAYGPPYNIMSYGLGGSENWNPVVGLDVEGHEFTHLLIYQIGNSNGTDSGLVYRGESGALNESFADIFGTCVEYYSGINPDWLIGEDVKPPFLRSMSNPNAANDPDTYGSSDPFWMDPNNLAVDEGGVHHNSGVQNYWFYLLCQGGAGTNKLNNAYSVTGIGINQARRIAYRNLVTYLGPNASFQDAYYGSLQAAEDLYGNPSVQYNAVKQAWFAVGVAKSATSYCSDKTILTMSSGTITDGSGSANYNNNSNCQWVIRPAGATQITLNFTAFNTEANYDTVFVYNGPDDTYPLLLTWWGNTLPATIKSTLGVGALCIKFTSDNTENRNGWSANYSSIGIAPTCEGATILSNRNGSFSDGSGTANYGNNQQCAWFISPPCASSVTLSFSQFNTELNYDGIIIYDGWENNSNMLASYSGSNIPSSITSNTGKMLVYFVSNYSGVFQGFTANYTSTGTANCSGTTNLNTIDATSFTDGSGANNYCNNLDCRWLIQPPQATSVTLNFTEFELEEVSTDGRIFYDAVEVYNGTTTSAPLLGRFAGNNLPPQITSTGGSMLVRFITDLEVNKKGFSAYYTSTQNPYCNGQTSVLTSQNGSFGDGSGTNNYANNSTCSWLIQPPNAASITLSFSSFNTELNYDGVVVYNGANNAAPVLGKFSGNNIPAPVTSTGGSMFIEFLSDPIFRAQGWSANYTSNFATSINEQELSKKYKIFPNPTNGVFNFISEFEGAAFIEIIDMLGKSVFQKDQVNKGNNVIDATALSKGLYMIKITFKNTSTTEKLIIN